MARTLGVIGICSAVWLVVHYWPSFVALAREFRAAVVDERARAAQREQSARLVSLARARRELADRARGRVLEMRTLRSSVSGLADTDDAA